MKALGWVLFSLSFASLSFQAEAQSLSCLGGTITTYNACPPCTSGRQTRAQAMCTQPADLQGRGCGSRTCETCTCEPDMFGRPGPSNTGSSRPAGSSTGTSRPVQKSQAPDPAPRGPKINYDPIVDLSDREIQQCLKREGRVEPLNQNDPTLVVVTLRNECDMCIRATIKITNGLGEVARSPLPGMGTWGLFNKRRPTSISFRVNNRNDWVWKPDVVVDAFDGKGMTCRN